MKGLIVIPAYNEAESIVNTVEELKQWIKENSKDYQIDYLIINDASTDNTEELIRKKKYNYISHCINQGSDGAAKSGIMYAFKYKYDFLLMYDGDGQHKPNCIIEMIDLLKQGNDIIIGSRFLNNDKPWTMRMLGSRLLSSIIYAKLGFKQKITDPTSGQRMINKQMIQELSSSAIGNEPSYLSKYAKKGYKIKELSVQMRERKAGESQFNLIYSAYFMLEQTLSIIFGY